MCAALLRVDILVSFERWWGGSREEDVACHRYILRSIPQTIIEEQHPGSVPSK